MERGFLSHIFCNGNLRSVKAFSSDIPALFYPELVSPGEKLYLEGDESRHIRALRLHSGDSVQLLSGTGWRSFGVLEEGDRGRFHVRVENCLFEGEDSGTYIGLAIGLLSDKNRMEWLVEKAVELGVRSIQPFRSERAEGFFRGDRLHRVAVAALKQSQRVWLPEIGEPVDWSGLANVVSSYNVVLICHEQESADEDLLTALHNVGNQQRMLILVGPEGGFSEEEVERGREEFNARIVSLGQTRLRSETAAIVALAAAELRNSIVKVQNSKEEERSV